MTNPYAPGQSLDAPVESSTNGPMSWKIGRGVATATVTLSSMLALWILLVQLLDRRSPLPDNLLWTGTLWISMLTSTFLVACTKHAFRPTFICPLSFAAFSFLYMLCEGPVFGDVGAGGDPPTTRIVIINLIALPAGALAASIFGLKFRTRPST